MSCPRNLLAWTCVAKIATFYMQRLHYERPYMTGSAFPGPAFLSMIANLMGWVLFLLPLYVWYRVGLAPAVTLFVVSFIVLQASSLFELFIFRMPTATMALISTPIGIAAFVMAVWSALKL